MKVSAGNPVKKCYWKQVPDCFYNAKVDITLFVLQFSRKKVFKHTPNIGKIH